MLKSTDIYPYQLSQLKPCILRWRAKICDASQSGARRLCGAAAPGALARTGRASDLDMRCGALPSLSAVVVLSLTFPRQSPRESPSRHLALLCVFRTHRMCAPNGVFKRRTTDRMRARERACRSNAPSSNQRFSSSYIAWATPALCLIFSAAVSSDAKSGSRSSTASSPAGRGRPAWAYREVEATLELSNM